jgi:YD repeat-containing protein
MPTGPTEVYREDRPGSYTETLTMSAVPHLTNGRPDGTEPIADIQTLSRTYISAGGQVTNVDDYYNLNAAAFADPSFESPYVGTGSFGSFQYDPSGSPWSFSSNSGVAGNDSGFTSGNPDAPDGTQVGFLQGANSTISQTIQLGAGSYTISFLAAQRENTQASSQTFAVLVDGATVGTFTPSSTSYAQYSTAAFSIAGGGMHTVTFQGLNPNGGDNTAFLDEINIQLASSVSIGDPGFETPNVGTGTYAAFTYDPTGSPWTFSPQTSTSGAGVAGNGSGFTSGNPDAPQGTQVGFLQGQGSSISQALTLAAGTYTASFFMAQRGNYQPGGIQLVEVLLDGNVVGTFAQAGTGYELLTTGTFTVTAGSHTVTFAGQTSGDSTAFIDQVSVQPFSGVVYSTAPDIGTPGVNFNRTSYGYDDLGRLNHVQSPNGTITDTVYDGLSRPVSTWVGTNDTPLSGEWSPTKRLTRRAVPFSSLISRFWPLVLRLKRRMWLQCLLKETKQYSMISTGSTWLTRRAELKNWRPYSRKADSARRHLLPGR